MPSSPPAPMIFFNVGWMRRYGGTFADDLTTGRHGHLKDNEHGAEAFNFAPVGGRLYGYRPPGDRNIAIERLGAKRGDERIEGVTVVWMALHRESGNTVVVGWYRNATVLREPAPLPASATGRDFGEYMVTARVEDSRLLTPQARQFRVLSSHRRVGGFGQSPTFYDNDDTVRTRMGRYIADIEANVGKGTRKGGARPPRNPDPEKRRLVERTAVDHATAFFESALGGGYEVESVEALGCGWDLECVRDDAILRVEVKGCSGSGVVAELTPNEYAKMQDPAFRPTYVVYIVTDCLTENPIASVFTHARRRAGRRRMGGASRSR